MQRTVLFALGLAVVFGLAAVQIKPAEASYRLFGTKEIASSKMNKFKKWLEVIDRYYEEQPGELAKCQPTHADPCHIAKWRIFLHKLKDHPPGAQLDFVNKYVNQYAYILDPINYGKKDYWATPKEFMYRTGDCEDYAIAKYASLLHLGWPKDSMRIVVLQDLNLNTPHAVLVVYVQGKAYLLDNQIPGVIEANRVKHYKPIFSINEGKWWLHRG